MEGYTMKHSIISLLTIMTLSLASVQGMEETKNASNEKEYVEYEYKKWYSLINQHNTKRAIPIVPLSQDAAEYSETLVRQIAELDDESAVIEINFSYSQKTLNLISKALSYIHNFLIHHNNDRNACIQKLAQVLTAHIDKEKLTSHIEILQAAYYFDIDILKHALAVLLNSNTISFPDLFNRNAHLKGEYSHLQNQVAKEGLLNNFLYLVNSNETTKDDINYSQDYYDNLYDCNLTSKIPQPSINYLLPGDLKYSKTLKNMLDFHGISSKKELLILEVNQYSQNILNLIVKLLRSIAHPPLQHTMHTREALAKILAASELNEYTYSELFKAALYFNIPALTDTLLFLVDPTENILYQTKDTTISNLIFAYAHEFIEKTQKSLKKSGHYKFMLGSYLKTDIKRLAAYLLKQEKFNLYANFIEQITNNQIKDIFFAEMIDVLTTKSEHELVEIFNTIDRENHVTMAIRFLYHKISNDNRIDNSKLNNIIKQLKEDTGYVNLCSVFTDDNDPLLAHLSAFVRLAKYLYKADDTRVALEKNNLTSIPLELCTLTQITHLYLKKNKLKKLPTEFGQLFNLKYIDLRKNRLTQLPAAFGKLTNLETLDLKHNKLKALPPEFGELSSLAHLNLEHNKLTTLPPEFGKLSCIDILHLEDNEIVTLPEEMSRITYSIMEIYLGDNPIKLSDVPEALRDYLEHNND